MLLPTLNNHYLILWQTELCPKTRPKSKPGPSECDFIWNKGF